MSTERARFEKNKERIALLTDSCADLDAKTRKNKPIFLLPLQIRCGDNEYVDNEELDLEAMLHDLKTTKSKSSTSCPNIYEWMQAFEGADHIFAVCITGNLSGSYAAAEQAKDLYLQDHPEAKIHVINTLTAGPEMRLIVEKLQSLIVKGMEFEYIVQAIEVYAQQSHFAESTSFLI